MPIKFSKLTELANFAHGALIDVRSPSEFEEDHIAGAINLPALSDQERAIVGKIYVQEDKFRARKVGAAMVSRNVADHLEGPLADMPGDWSPLVYCWRGGQRSGSFASILQQIGWRAETIDGGYKAYRRLVVDLLYQQTFAAKIVLIDGPTGTAKTRLLASLEKQGAQVIDLEAMAEHRGSLFGPMGHSQPAQKAFESRLAMSVARLDTSRPVFIEAESNKIGHLIVPPMLWQPMIRAASVVLSAPIASRVAHLVTEYEDLRQAPERLEGILDMLVRYHGQDQVSQWKALATEGAFETLVEELIVQHYDPRYRRITGKDAPEVNPVSLSDLSECSLDSAAAEIIALHGQ